MFGGGFLMLTYISNQVKRGKSFLALAHSQAAHS
jgi:hypothetical protein